MKLFEFISFLHTNTYVLFYCRSNLYFLYFLYAAVEQKSNLVNFLSILITFHPNEGTCVHWMYQVRQRE